MKKTVSYQDGFVTIFVLMLAAALLLLLGVTMNYMYRTHDRNRQIKQELLHKIERLNQRSTPAPSVPGQAAEKNTLIR